MSALTIEEVVLDATNEMHLHADMSAMLNIVDLLNRKPAYGPDVLRVLKKRLGHKHVQVASSALTLLDMLMKNCGSIRTHVATSDFMNAFVKSLPKKVRDPTYKPFIKTKSYGLSTPEENEVHERTLVLLQSWANSLTDPRFDIFRQVVHDLRRKLVVFPEPTVDEVAPIITPARHQQQSKPNSGGNSSSNNTGNASTPPNASAQDSGIFADTNCQRAFSTSKLLIDSLTASEVGTDLQRDELISEFYTVVHGLHKTLQLELQQPAVQAGDPQYLDELFRASDICDEAQEYFKGLVRGTMQRRVPEKAPVVDDANDAKQANATAEDIAPNNNGSGDLMDFFGGGATTTTTNNSNESNNSTVSKPEGKKMAVVPMLAPPPEEETPKSKKKHRNRHASGGSSIRSPGFGPGSHQDTSNVPVADLLDMELFGGAPVAAAAPVVAAEDASSPKKKKKKKKKGGKSPTTAAPAANNDDDDFFQLASGGAAVNQSAAAPEAEEEAEEDDGLDDLFDSLALGAE